MALLIDGCAYRFTNQHTNIPKGIRTISFEAIYDTSRQVLPHHILWESLQRAFAADGHLRVVSQGRADAVLRAHITDANIVPRGSADQVGEKKDLNVDAVPPPEPDSFRNLTQAGEHTKSELLNFKVNIEVINLYTQKNIFSKAYSGQKAFRTSRDNERASLETLYLMYEEALNSKFRDISDDIAQSVVRDFTVGR